MNSFERPTKDEAHKLLDWIASLDPAWAERIKAMQEERGTDPLQTIAILCCYTLESGQHMAIPVIEQLMDGFLAAGKVHTCPECEQEYTLVYPGQPFCSNDCANASRAKQTPAPSKRYPEHTSARKPRTPPPVEYPARE